MKKPLGSPDHQGVAFQKANNFITPVSTIVDIGSGIQPVNFFNPKRHICIEPYEEYAEILKENGYEVIEDSAINGLKKLKVKPDSIFLIDVIEHMDKETGKEVIKECLLIAQNQVVVFTPIGFVEQSYKDGEKDAWGYDGTYWQTHRSGWTPDDFPGWKIITNKPINNIGVFFAIYDRNAVLESS